MPCDSIVDSCLNLQRFSWERKPGSAAHPCLPDRIGAELKGNSRLMKPGRQGWAALPGLLPRLAMASVVAPTAVCNTHPPACGKPRAPHLHPTIADCSCRVSTAIACSIPARRCEADRSPDLLTTE